MFSRVLLSISGAVLLAGCVDTTQGGGNGSAVAAILDRPLSNESGTVTVNSDGTVTGALGGADVALTWDEENGLFCRAGTVGSTTLERRCQSVVVEGSTVAFVNPDGSVSSTYTMG